jgi:hypothetical protein
MNKYYLRKRLQKKQEEMFYISHFFAYLCTQNILFSLNF